MSGWGSGLKSMNIVKMGKGMSNKYMLYKTFMLHMEND